jgi:hypothetical protein
MAVEQLRKFDPRRTVHLGVSPLSATLTAAIHSTSENAFSVSGVFRDRVDKAEVILYDADDYFGHPRWKWLPHFDFAGMVLEFDLLYDDLQPIESPKFPWIDWPYLNVLKADGTAFKIRLWDYATLVNFGSWPAAAGTLTFTEGAEGVAQFDRVTLFYLGIGWDYIVPKVKHSYQFFAGTPGTVHRITVAGVNYEYTEQSGDTSAAVAVALVGAINAGAGDPYVVAAQGVPTHQVDLDRRKDDGGSFVISSTAEGGTQTLYGVTLSTVVKWFATAINDANWNGIGAPVALRADRNGNNLNLKAARYGKVDTLDNLVTWISGERFSGLTGGDAIRIAGVDYTVTQVNSPTELLIAPAAPGQGSVNYLAPRGGYDGNMVTVFERHKNDNLKCSQASVKLAGGNSEVTWRIRLDFSALDITQIRRMWLTLAPRLVDSGAYSNTEWTARFSNITVTDPNGFRTLKIADPKKSVRVGSRSRWAVYSGVWTEEASNGFYRGYGRSTSQIGAKVTITIWCQYAHDLWLGTILGAGHGVYAISVDGDAPTTLDAANGDGWARRKIRSGLAAGKHNVEVTLASAGIMHFDFLDAVVEADVPDPEVIYSDVAVATDYDTDHSYRLPPERLVWQIHRSGLRGRINHFVGILFYAQRVRINGIFPQSVVTFGGTWADGDTVTLTFGATSITKTVVAADTLNSIAEQLAGAINAVFTACWASVAGAVLTITVRSPVDIVDLSTAKTSAAGTVSVSGDMSASATRSLGTYVIDAAADPVFDLAARSWHADFFSAARAYGIEVVSTFSFDMTNPPEDPGGGQVWASRYANNDQATFQVVPGFNGTHCTFSSTILAYHKRVYRYLADLMNAAGLGIWLQFGEFLWWYAQGDVNQKTAFYDSDTTAAAQAALGRALQVFATLNDSPAVNGYADADFLRARLQAHVDAIRAHVLASHPSAKFELLWARDVNRDDQQLSLYVNLPPAFWQKAGSGLDTFKMEALSFGAFEHNLAKAIEAMRFPMTPPRAWSSADLWYNLPVLSASAVYERELIAARGLGLKVSLWAWDHFTLKGLALPLPEAGRRGRLVA